MTVVLDERRTEDSSERVAVFETDVAHRLHGVEVLGHRHGKAGGAEFVDEPLEHVEHHGVTVERDASGAKVGKPIGAQAQPPV
ncbi:MAG: hypothetical protein M5U31_09525 [Acidimicrobiia bacterium]|nr:hypothetical protein [Acidimicrobiia bacterium]